MTLWLTAMMAPMYGSELPGAAADSARGAQHTRWIVRGGALWLRATGDEAGDVTVTPELPAGARRQKGISDGPGFGLGLEYLPRRHFGVELTALVGEIGADLTLNVEEVRSTDSQDIGFTAVTLGVNYHLTPAKRADVYVGAFAQRSDYDDVTHRFPEAGRSARLTFDEALGWGLKAGLDTPIRPGGSWIFSATIQHLREPLDVKPVIASIGVGYRF